MGHDAELLAVAGAGGAVSPYRDFTTLTEVDIGGFITIDSATELTVASQTKDNACYAYWDDGAAFYSGDFVHRFKHVPKNPNTTHTGAIWAMTNDKKSLNTISDDSGDYLAIATDAVGGQRIFLVDTVGGSVTISGFQILTTDVDYFLTLRRDETAGFLYLDMSLNSDFSAPFGTLSVALKGDIDYQYLMPVQNFLTGAGGQFQSWKNFNYEIVS